METVVNSCSLFKLIRCDGRVVDGGNLAQRGAGPLDDGVGVGRGLASGDQCLGDERGSLGDGRSALTVHVELSL